MSYRFDKRTKEEFKKDIAFGTLIEKFFFRQFLQSGPKYNQIRIYAYEDNGVCNDGKFIPDGQKTSGADYKVDIKYNEKHYWDLPLEVKWVPTYGKLTLKEGDLKAYIREGAAILFIYTTKKLNLKKPKDRNFDAHTKLILNNRGNLRWGIMFPDDVKRLLEENQDKIQKIFYMGNKPGIILPQEEFKKWFKEECL